MQLVRGLVIGAIVGGVMYVYLTFTWLRATQWFAVVASVGLGLAIFAVVGTRSDGRGAAQDAAWRAAAPDLPPVSDRAALEEGQVRIPAPARPRKRAGS